MKKNIGCLDRTIRFLAFDLMIGFSLYGVEVPQTLNIILIIIGLYLSVTFIFGFSPIYYFLKFSTIEKEDEKNKKE